MSLDICLPFAERYELRHRRWLDGPYASWRAHDRCLGREVVVNIPYRNSDDEWFVEIGRNRARLCHANLVPVYDLRVTNQDRPYFTERPVEATDLASLLRHGDDTAANTELPRLVSYLLDACKAVAYLHANGHLHLDLHPGSILVGPATREVFLVGGQPFERPTQGAMLARPAYMAPEQADLEQPALGDARTDVYALGGILFEILFGKPPNASEWASSHQNLAALQAIVARQGPPQGGALDARALISEDFARALEPIVMRATQSDRDARHAKVSAFMNEVEAVLWCFG